MERVPYGSKTIGNLLRCHLKGFSKNLRGFEKVDPGAEIVCYSSQKWPETDVFREVIKFETIWPAGLPWWCYALNYGWYVEEGSLE
jgi:hypothetical protein